MSEILAGTVSGVLMGLVFIGVGAVMFFSLLKDSPRLSQAFSKESSLASMAVPVAFVSQVIWAVVGLVMGILYGVSVEQAPGSGMGSPNLVYTLAVVVLAGALLIPFFILLRRVWKEMLLLYLAFIGIFGWFLPYFSR